MRANLPYFVPERLEIGESVRFLGGVAEQGSGMIGAHHPDTAFEDKLAVLAGDLKLGINDFTGGDAAQADQDFRPKQTGLLPKPMDTGILFLRTGIPVLGRAAFDDIGDIDVVLAG